MSNFSNSPLAENNPKYHATSNNYTEGRVVNGKAYKIDTLTPHVWVGHPKTKAIHASPFQKSKQCSCNYGIMDDGSSYVCVDEANRSWCSSNRYNDVRAITFEIASDTTDPYKITDAALEALIKLSIDICKRNGIKNMTWIPDKDKALAYQKNLPEGEGVWTLHRWFTSKKSCPGPYVISKMEYINDQVNKGLGVEETKPAPSPSQPAPAPATPDNDTIEALARRVINGEFGNGEARKKALGDLYPVVQAKVNELLGYTKKIYWRVQCGAFKSKDGAVALQNKLKAKGYDTYLVYVNNLYKVQLGAFSSKLNADTLASKLSFDGFDTYVLQY